MRSMATLILLICLSSATPSYGAEDIIIIKNASTHHDALTRKSLKSIFSMRWRTWDDGSPIKVIVMDDDSDTHRKFTTQILGIFPHQLRKVWNRIVFSGTGQSPRAVDNSEQMIELVKNTPGAIGYIPKSHAVENLLLVEVIE